MPVLAALVPAAIGVGQLVGGIISKNRASNAISGIQPPSYAPNKAINDYYQTALNRYQAGALNSTEYQVAKQQNAQGLGAGIGALQQMGRGAAANAGALVNQNANNNARSLGQAEQTNQKNLGQLGQAAGMQASDSKFAYQQNQLLPYQQKLQLQYAKLGGASSLINAGISNISTGAQTGAMLALKNKGYGADPNNTYS